MSPAPLPWHAVTPPCLTWRRWPAEKIWTNCYIWERDWDTANLVVVKQNPGSPGCDRSPGHLESWFWSQRAMSSDPASALLTYGTWGKPLNFPSLSLLIWKMGSGYPSQLGWWDEQVPRCLWIVETWAAWLCSELHSPPTSGSTATHAYEPSYKHTHCRNLILHSEIDFFKLLSYYTPQDTKLNKTLASKDANWKKTQTCP